MTHYKFYEANVETNQVLVFLHGFLSDSRTYHNHIEKFTDNYHVITIDLPALAKISLQWMKRGILIILRRC